MTAANLCATSALTVRVHNLACCHLVLVVESKESIGTKGIPHATAASRTATCNRDPWSLDEADSVFLTTIGAADERHETSSYGTDLFQGGRSAVELDR